MNRSSVHIFLVAITLQFCWFLLDSCAQIGAPMGGPKDTVAPLLIKAYPNNNQTNFKGNKITLYFNEFIELQDLQSNLLVSPVQKNNPAINSNLKTITIKIKDSLLPNTTYSVDLGNSVKDINEGNIYKNLCYTFSTGDYIDSLELKGKVVLAESGKTDSTLKVLLYKNTADSAVQSSKPDYITYLNGNGSFTFKNLPKDDFKVFALKDGDGNKYYSLKSEIFAFYDGNINTENKYDSLILFAYAEKKDTPALNTSDKKIAEKKLRYSTNLINGKQDLLSPLELSFSTSLKTFNKDSLFITDTNYIPLQNVSTDIDLSGKIITISNNWKQGEVFYLMVVNGGMEDSTGRQLLKSDTIRFITKNVSDYGSLKLTFTGLDFSKHPLLELLEGDRIKWKFPIISKEWSNKLMNPGEYEIRILYDENNNGQWDPGNYQRKIQPERAISLPQKISIKADWDNERDIQL